MLDERSVLCEIVREATGTEPAEQPVRVGHSGTMWRVNGCYVRAVMEPDPVEYSLDLPRREAAALRLIRERQAAPVPEVLHYGRKLALICDIPHHIAFNVQQALPGSNAHEDPPKDLYAFGFQAGSALRELHGITGNGCGYVDDDGFACNEGWDEFLKARFFRVLSELNGSLSEHYLRDVGECVRFVPDARRPMSLLQHDGHRGNLLHSSGRLTGLVDFTGAIFGDGLSDLAMHMDGERQDYVNGLVQGYTLGHGLEDSKRRDVVFYQLLEHLWNAYKLSKKFPEREDLFSSELSHASQAMRKLLG